MCSSRGKHRRNRDKSRSEICRLCLMEKWPFVNIFETIARDGCPLSEKLNEFFGIDAVAGDDLPECVCLDCLRGIKRGGSISYDLWSTLEYLVEMDEQSYMQSSIPEETLRLLLHQNEQQTALSGGLQGSVGMDDATAASHGDTMKCKSDGGEDSSGEDGVEIEYCWCSECTAEFCTREELRTHLKTHSEGPQVGSLGVNDESVTKTEEFRLLCGNDNRLKSKLCCGRCMKQFKNERRLVKHINKYDFKCRPKAFEVLKTSLEKVVATQNQDTSLLKPPAGTSYSLVNSNSVELMRTKGDGLGKVMNESESCTGQRKDVSKPRVVRSYANVNVDCVSSSGYMKSFESHSRESSNVKMNLSSAHLTGQTHSYINDLINVEGKVKDCHPKTVDTSKINPVRNQVLVNRPSEVVVRLDDGNTLVNFKVVLICDYCGKRCEEKSKLRSHMEMCHLSPVVLKCLVCHTVFPSEQELNLHTDMHKSEKKFICSICSENFSSRVKLTAHMNGSHDSTKACVCSACLCGFPSRVELGLHHLCHSQDKSCKCPTCGRSFLSKRSYKGHLVVCERKCIPFKCEICGKEFSGKHQLTRHSFIHSRQEKFSCELCPKKFTQLGMVYLHVRKEHMKLKPHECEICKRKFSVRSCLLKHYAVHSDQRPFSCDLCGMNFKLRYNADRHKKAKHMGMIYGGLLSHEVPEGTLPIPP